MTAIYDPDVIIADAQRAIDRWSEWAHEFAAEVVRLREDRDLLVRVLREQSDGMSDYQIAFRFDAPGARLHERLRRILTESDGGSPSTGDDQ